MMSISVIAVLAILIGVNWAVTRRDKRWDLTAAASYTLSDQTVKVVSNLKTPVKVLVFDVPNGFQRFRDSLGLYESASPNIQVEYVDMDREPARAREYAIVAPGTVVMEYDGRREKVMSDREQDLTNALIKVTTGRQVKAYFVQGHGERNTTGNDRLGYASVVDALKRDNYTVDTVVLAQSQAGVPADASVLILAGPTADYLKPEVDAIRTYLRKGGKALFLLDPPVGESARTAPTVEALLKEWGITPGTRRRHRHQRHGPVARHRRVGSGCRELSTASGYRELRSAHGVPARPVGERRSRHGAGHGKHPERDQHERAKLVRV